MTISVEHRPQGKHRLVLDVSGHVDQHTYEVLEAALTDAIDQGMSKIYVDLSKVSYMSSAGIGILAGASAKLADVEGGAFALIAPAQPVMHVFESMGFASFFWILPTLPEDLMDEKMSQKASSS